MPRLLPLAFCLLSCGAAALCLTAVRAQDEQVAIREAEAALARGLKEALPLLNRLPPYSAGMILARAGHYAQAETFLSRALAAAPGDFKVLYNLGVAASFAGHHERAREVLGTALRQQPRNVDVLYSLAYVEAALKQKEVALRRLAQAAQVAPRRADVQKLLAIVTGDLGAFADSLAAWDRYLKLAPGDDFARRERGYTAACLGQFEPGIADLEWFLARHPNDEVGHYYLGLARSEADPAAALSHLDQALALKKDFAEARTARGSLYYRQGKPEAALPDLEAAAAARPDHALTLDRLGQTYLALDRPADAVRLLRRAAALAPEDSRIQLHLGRALAEAGESAESKVVMDRFRQLGPRKKPIVPPGLVEYLSRTPEEQRADYRARVEKAVAKDPGDAAAQERYLHLLLEDRQWDQAAAAARRLAALRGPSADVNLDLAITTFHAAGAGAALPLMDRIPEAERGGEYHLARAHMLEASGRSEEALAALDQALRAAPQRPDLYHQAAAFLAQKGELPAALRVLEQAVRAAPQNRELLLMRATTLELAGQAEAAQRLLGQIQNRWPEWHAGWVAQGVILATGKRFEEARQALETAVALGARSAEVHYYLADCTLRAAPQRREAAAAAARQALKLAPDDPWIQSLARSFEQGRTPPRRSPAAAEPPPYARRLFLLKPPREW